MNVGLCAQIRQLLFAGCRNRNPNGEAVPEERIFKAPNDIENDPYIEPGREGKPPKKLRPVLLKSAGLCLTPDVYTASGLPAVSSVVLRQLAGRPGAAGALLQQLADLKAAHGEGTAAFRDRFGVWLGDVVMAKMEMSKFVSMCGAKGGSLANLSADQVERGLQACDAVDALCEAAAVDTLLSNFIISLQSDRLRGRDRDRIHCSLNLNTETGRLSARRPNLQNQPALEKDRYQVRLSILLYF